LPRKLGIIAGRHGNRSTNNAPRNTYVTRDGRWVAISASAISIAERVIRLVGRPDIATKPWFASAGERVQRGELLDAAVSSWIRARDFDEVHEKFQEAGAALAPIYDVEQLVNGPQVAALEAMWADPTTSITAVRRAIAGVPRRGWVRTRTREP